MFRRVFSQFRLVPARDRNHASATIPRLLSFQGLVSGRRERLDCWKRRIYASLISILFRMRGDAGVELLYFLFFDWCEVTACTMFVCTADRKCMHSIALQVTRVTHNRIEQTRSRTMVTTEIFILNSNPIAVQHLSCQIPIFQVASPAKLRFTVCTVNRLCGGCAGPTRRAYRVA